MNGVFKIAAIVQVLWSLVNTRRSRPMRSPSTSRPIRSSGGVVPSHRGVHRRRQPRDLRRHLQPDDFWRELPGADAFVRRSRVSRPLPAGGLSRTKSCACRLPTGRNWSRTCCVQRWPGECRDFSSRIARDKMPVSSFALRRLVLVRTSLAVMKSPSIRHGRYYDWQDIATISSLSRILSGTWPSGAGLLSRSNSRDPSSKSSWMVSRYYVTMTATRLCVPAASDCVAGIARQAFAICWVKTWAHRPYRFLQTGASPGNQRHVAGRFKAALRRASSASSRKSRLSAAVATGRPLFRRWALGRGEPGPQSLGNELRRGQALRRLRLGPRREADDAVRCSGEPGRFAKLRGDQTGRREQRLATTRLHAEAERQRQAPAGLCWR